MEENSHGETLRTALGEALREHDAVEEMFEKDTGADEVNIQSHGSHVSVVLNYYRGEDL